MPFVPRFERAQESDFLAGAGDPAFLLFGLRTRHLLAVDQFEGDLPACGEAVGAPDHAISRAGQASRRR